MVSLNAKTCSRCGKCVLVCKHGVFVQNGPGTVPAIDPEIEKHCTGCFHCMAVCPADSIKVDGAGTGEFAALSEKPLSFDAVLPFLRGRRSCRNYKKEKVPGELIAKVVLAARYAPTAKNSQAVEIVVVEGAKVRELAALTFEFYGELVSMLSNPFKTFMLGLFAGFATVPVLRANKPLFEMAIESFKNGTDYLFYDAPAVIVTHSGVKAPMPKDDCDYALMSMVLAAESLGLGTCINGFLSKAGERSEKIKKFLGIPKANQIFNSMTIGIPSVKFRRTVSRRPPSVTFVR